MAKLLSTFILQMLFAFFTSSLLQITSTDHLSVHPGENITLLCNITNYSEISWYRLRSEEVKLLISAVKGNLKKQFILSYNVNVSHFDITESSSSVSLVIIGVRETDLGFYYCGGRNKTTHIQFGKPIRLNFTEDQHRETDHSDTQQSAPPAHCGDIIIIIIIIILSCVCVVSVSISITCSSLYCSSLQDKCSFTGDSDEKVAEKQGNVVDRRQCSDHVTIKAD
ncbi:uncharacterized protein LOC117598059 isoform X1 [Pangasianodon hypophthalmus]|uniref:uncharacterized protein LOC117598059 isoform X1 n=1 Tax=Pangasianodon hypophthalmus TaxID=310915 RepID=UPI00230780E4|nr:uncharacterized protein LOC117598059 isoform X1 [Pangasianodon hypophthalmus]